jgi:hypothetical protein
MLHVEISLRRVGTVDLGLWNDSVVSKRLADRFGA